jgi:acetylglutamate kinase
MREELGQVGEPVRSDASLLRTLINSGYLPVVACVAGDSSGRFYNVNADQMAASLAAAFGAQKLVFLTDVDGVRNEKSDIFREITTTECSDLIRSGIANGGMRAKLEAAAKALQHDVGEVVIAPGAVPGAIRELLRGGRLGTRILWEVGISNHG